MVPQPLPNPSPLAPLVHVCTEESVNRHHVFLVSGTTIITDRTTEVFYCYAYSTRKRMSVIVRTPEGKIKLYCKGAVSSGTLNSPQTKSIIDCKTVVFFSQFIVFHKGQSRRDLTTLALLAKAKIRILLLTVKILSTFVERIIVLKCCCYLLTCPSLL